MTIHAQIKAGIKESMIKKDELRLTVLRGLQAAFTNEMIAKKIAGDEIGDEEALAVIRRGVKQRKDSIEQFEKGGRKDLAEKEAAELKLLEAFLPAQMSKEDIMKVVEAQKAKMGGAIDKAKLGQFMGAVMKELKGKADGTLVKEIVENSL